MGRAAIDCHLLDTPHGHASTTLLYLMPTITQFERALRQIKPPSEGVLKMLRAHASAKNRTSIARRLAEAAGYQSYRGFNSGYGRLARQIGQAMGRTNADIGLLVEFERPGALKNSEYLVFMREEFAQALQRADWI